MTLPLSSDRKSAPARSSRPKMPARKRDCWPPIRLSRSSRNSPSCTVRRISAFSFCEPFDPSIRPAQLADRAQRDEQEVCDREQHPAELHALQRRLARPGVALERDRQVVHRVEQRRQVAGGDERCRIGVFGADDVGADQRGEVAGHRRPQPVGAPEQPFDDRVVRSREDRSRCRRAAWRGRPGSARRAWRPKPATVARSSCAQFVGDGAGARLVADLEQVRAIRCDSVRSQFARLRIETASAVWRDNCRLTPRTPRKITRNDATAAASARYLPKYGRSIVSFRSICHAGGGYRCRSGGASLRMPSRHRQTCTAAAVGLRRRWSSGPLDGRWPAVNGRRRCACASRGDPVRRQRPVGMRV